MSTPYSCSRPYPRSSLLVRAILELLSGLSCTVYPTQDALYKQLANIRILHRESALRSAHKTDEPIANVLRKAPVLSSTMDEQYTASTLTEVARLEQSLVHQNTASVLRSLASHRGGKGTALKTVLWSRPGWLSGAWLQRT